MGHESFNGPSAAQTPSQQSQHFDPFAPASDIKFQLTPANRNAMAKTPSFAEVQAMILSKKKAEAAGIYDHREHVNYTIGGADHFGTTNTTLGDTHDYGQARQTPLKMQQQFGNGDP